MQASLSTPFARRFPAVSAGGIALLLLTALLWLPEGRALWAAWQSDASLSHGPLVPLLTLGHLWMQRDRLRRWNAAAWPGLGCLLLCALIYVGAVWADIDFLKPLALIGMCLGSVWFLGGAETLGASLGAIGFLVFMIPWPTTLIDRLAFPLQLMSSAYAALLAGMLGIPIHREGVNLAVMPGMDAPPVYAIVVAQACSGLTSLLVLLALGYLIAYHTPVRWPWKALILGAIVPLTLCANAVRLTVILIAGAHHKPGLAKWIHDHEGPVLIFFCSLALNALRHGILIWSQPYPRLPETLLEGNAVVALPPVDPQ